ncbi:hypothetical protein F4679DRAFT_551514 [Xylaria curta]|nr:hypothetical protein F4679DRAFT_551514 [Xylaria curta]
MEGLPLYQPSGHSGALPGHKIHATIRESMFKLPTLPSTPIIMIATGTGITVFFGFIQERVRRNSIGRLIGAMVLFFGCWNPQEDYLHIG